MIPRGRGAITSLRKVRCPKPVQSSEADGRSLGEAMGTTTAWHLVKRPPVDK